VKLDTAKTESSFRKSTPKPVAEEDLSHLPEAVRKAILRSRALRGEEIPGEYHGREKAG
jgi:hypothetical protein